MSSVNDVQRVVKGRMKESLSILYESVGVYVCVYNGCERIERG